MSRPPGAVLGDPLPRGFFDRPVLEVAPALLGHLVVHDGPGGRVVLRLTEVEAYDGGNDAGSHAFRGPTRRNAVMFGPPGHVYVYFTYGMHWCMNLVCGPAGRAAAVLLRAGEVVDGEDLARSRRPTARSRADLARGPARLTRALGVDGGLNGADACAAGSVLRVVAGPSYDAGDIRRGPRTGVGGVAAHHPWRFWVEGQPSVSRYRAHAPKRRRSLGAVTAAQGMGDSPA